MILVMAARKPIAPNSIDAHMRIGKSHITKSMLYGGARNLSIFIPPARKFFDRKIKEHAELASHHFFEAEKLGALPKERGKK